MSQILNFHFRISSENILKGSRITSHLTSSTSKIAEWEYRGEIFKRSLGWILATKALWEWAAFEQKQQLREWDSPNKSAGSTIVEKRPRVDLPLFCRGRADSNPFDATKL